MPSLSCDIEIFPIAGRFVIARGAKTEAQVVTVTLREGSLIGRGECVPYGRYGETIDGVVAAIRAVAPAIAAGADRAHLQELMPRGAARNAVDCALWDLEAKASGVRVAARAGCPMPSPVVTAYTLSLDTPEAMHAAAVRAADRPLLKIKLGADDPVSRLTAVRTGAPRARLIVDANEGWRPDAVEALLAACRAHEVALVEQPLPAGDDALLAQVAHPVPICADESVHGVEGLAALQGRYDAVNIKLDKTGGLTEALAVAAEAERLGFALMIGCMVGSSLAMAPALLLAGRAAFVDLDGPLLLARDRTPGLVYEGSTIRPADPALWG